MAVRQFFRDRIRFAASLALGASAACAGSDSSGSKDEPQTSPPPEPVELTRQLAVHGPSRMRSFASTRDGHVLFLGEGATMVFIDTFDEASGTFDASAFRSQDGFKRVPIGERGVLPNAILLDPDAGDPPGALSPSTPGELLYLAAGRDGLWVMEADVDATVENRAWRVDDSEDADTSTQDGARWCTALAIAPVGDDDFLLALFGRKGDSLLRAYRLDRVRAVADPLAPELGGEIAPDGEVALGDHDGLGPVALDLLGPEYGRSVALGMDADAYVDPGTGQSWVDVYVAMAHHGLARVRIRPPAGGQGAPVLEGAWGPVFGSDTPYAFDPTRVPADKTGAAYGHADYEHVALYHDEASVDRSERPVFCDVAVYRGVVDGQPVRHVYAAVDHLGWAVWDLENEPWSAEMPILHHEGLQVTRAPDPELGFFLPQTYVRPLYTPVPEERDVKDVDGGTVRALAIAEHGTRGPYLVVTTGRKCFLKEYLTTGIEGLAVDEDFYWSGGAALSFPTSRRTLWYPIRAWNESHQGQASFADGLDGVGGRLAVPAVQDLDDRLKVFTDYHLAGQEQGGTGTGMCLTLARLDSALATETLRRDVRDTAGTMCFEVTTSLLNPNVIFTGHNDGDVPKDGFLVSGVDPATNEYRTVRHYTGPGPEEPGPDGPLFDGEAQWPAPEPDHQYFWCGGGWLDPADGLRKLRWLLAEFFVPQGADAFDPDRGPRTVKKVYFEPTPDGFGGKPRLYYMNSYATPSGIRGIFGTYQRTPEGLIVLDPADVLDAFDAAANDVSVDAEDVGSIHLVTHPEFNRMPRKDPTLRQFWDDQLAHWAVPNKRLQDEIGLVQTWGPKVFTVPDPDGGPDRWILAVACKSIRTDPDWDIYDPHWHPDSDGDGRHEWYPLPGTIWSERTTHGLVQFWELAFDGERYWPVTIEDPGRNGKLEPDTDLHSDDVPHNSPLSKIVGPDPKGNILHVEPLRMEVDGADRVFLFCADAGGRLYVYSVEDLLTYTEPDSALPPETLVASWYAPPSGFDDLPEFVFDVAVDYRGGKTAMVYVPVRRVGVVALRFDPRAAEGAPILEEVGRIQTAEYVFAVDLRTNGDGSRHLVVTDHGGGIRVYGE